MKSISFSDYRQDVAALVKDIIPHPDMYYHELSHLEALLDGHWMAYEPLCGLTRENAFSVCFVEWLCKTRSSPRGGCGWAPRIEDLAKKMDRYPDLLFAELVNEFLAEWTANDSK